MIWIYTVFKEGKEYGGKGNIVMPYNRLRIVHKQLHDSKQADFALKYTLMTSFSVEYALIDVFHEKFHIKAQ